jgi:hypothetical protein
MTMKKPPEGGFLLLLQRTLFKRRLESFKPGGLPNELGGQGQGLDFGRQTALVASSLVFVEDAFVSHGVNHSLHLGEQFGGFDFVASQDCFFNILDSGAVFGAQ